MLISKRQRNPSHHGISTRGETDSSSFATINAASICPGILCRLDSFAPESLNKCRCLVPWPVLTSRMAPERLQERVNGQSKGDAEGKQEIIHAELLKQDRRQEARQPQERDHQREGP